MPRRVLSGEGRQRRQVFRLRAWFQSDPQIRQDYFARIDNIIAELQTEEGDPPDTAIVEMLAIKVENDPSFDDHLLGITAQIPDDLKEIREAAAGVVLEAHIREKENGTWP